MTAAVFDSSIIVAGAGWRGEAHLCLAAMARRRVKVFTSDWILEEVNRAVLDFGYCDQLTPLTIFALSCVSPKRGVDIMT